MAFFEATPDQDQILSRVGYDGQSGLPLTPTQVIALRALGWASLATEVTRVVQDETQAQTVQTRAWQDVYGYGVPGSPQNPFAPEYGITYEGYLNAGPGGGIQGSTYTEEELAASIAYARKLTGVDVEAILVSGPNIQGEALFPDMALPPIINPKAASMALSMSSNLSPGFTADYPGFGGGQPTWLPPPIGGVVGLGVTICTQLGLPPSLCNAAGQLISMNNPGYAGGQQGGGGGTSLTGGSQLTVDCPQGYVFNADTGQCEVAGTGGAIQRILPGGQTGQMMQGTPVMGAWGMPAVLPRVVGSIGRDNGITGPILKCPSRMVLGADNLCYMKPLAARYRKWKPAPRAPVTAGDARAIRLAASAKKRVKGLAGKVGFSCSPKGSRRGK